MTSEAYKVDMSKQPPRSVAGDFLEAHNILRAIDRTNNLILNELKKKTRKDLPEMPKVLKSRPHLVTEPPPLPKECVWDVVDKRVGMIETMLEEEAYFPSSVLLEVRELRKLLNQLR